MSDRKISNQTDAGLAYLDNAATTPMSTVATHAWLDTVQKLQKTPGNPSSLHQGGRAARRMLEDARDQIASVLGAEKAEVIFTSGATESNAIGVLGVARGIRNSDPARKQIIASGIEHDAVAEQQTLAEVSDFCWETLDVDRQGISDTSIEDPGKIAIASMSLVCAETGVIQPVKELTEKGFLVHTDAAQAIGHIPVNFAELGVDLLSMGGHKVGAPVGIGVLLAKRGVKVVTDRAGGGHERKLRSGTQDVAGAVALAVALDEMQKAFEKRQTHFQMLKEYLKNGLPSTVSVTTDAPSSPAIIHLSMETSHPEILLMVMDQHGVMVSAGSACHAGVTRPSEILMRMGRGERGALGVLRVSFGPNNTVEDVDQFLQALPLALSAAQQLDNRDS